MIATTCPHDDDPNLCPPCVRERGADPAPTSWATVRRLPARYVTPCPSCGDPITLGELLGQQTDGAGNVRYVCQACA